MIFRIPVRLLYLGCFIIYTHTKCCSTSYTVEMTCTLENNATRTNVSCILILLNSFCDGHVNTISLFWKFCRHINFRIGNVSDNNRRFLALSNRIMQQYFLLVLILFPQIGNIYGTTWVMKLM